jgi:hypothetical protein
VLDAADNQQAVQNQLDKNRGVVEFVDLNDTFITDTQNLQRDVFGIKSASTNPGTLNFTNTNTPIAGNKKSPTYQIFKLFHGVGSDANETEEWKIWGQTYSIEIINNDKVKIKGVTYGEGDEFNLTAPFGGEYNFTVDLIDVENKRVWFNHRTKPNVYRFANFVNTDAAYPVNDEIDRIALSSTGNRPGVIVNQTGPGRAVWVSQGDGDDIRGLLKSAIIWAAGPDWWNILRTVSGEYVEVGYFLSPASGDVYEPHEVKLSLWWTY